MTLESSAPRTFFSTSPTAIRVNEQNEVTDKTRNDIITRYDIIKIKKSQAGIEIIYGFAWERKGENI